MMDIYLTNLICISMLLDYIDHGIDVIMDMLTLLHGYI